MKSKITAAEAKYLYLTGKERKEKELAEQRKKAAEEVYDGMQEKIIQTSNEGFWSITYPRTSFPYWLEEIIRPLLEKDGFIWTPRTEHIEISWK